MNADNYGEVRYDDYVKIEAPTKAGQRFSAYNKEPTCLDIPGRDPFWLRGKCRLWLISMKNDLPKHKRVTQDPYVWVIQRVMDEADE